MAIYGSYFYIKPKYVYVSKMWYCENIHLLIYPKIHKVQDVFSLFRQHVECKYDFVKMFEFHHLWIIKITIVSDGEVSI